MYIRYTGTFILGMVVGAIALFIIGIIMVNIDDKKKK